MHQFDTTEKPNFFIEKPEFYPKLVYISIKYIYLCTSNLYHFMANENAANNFHNSKASSEGIKSGEVCKQYFGDQINWHPTQEYKKPNGESRL